MWPYLLNPGRRTSECEKRPKSVAASTKLGQIPAMFTTICESYGPSNQPPHVEEV